MLFVWFCIDAATNARIQKVSSYGLEFLLKTYLMKSFQKVIWLLSFQQHSIPSPPSSSIARVEDSQAQFVERLTRELTQKMLRFVRGAEISKAIQETLYLGTFQTIDLFLIPDALLVSNEYYRDLLRDAMSCFSPEEQKKVLDKDNTQAKHYLAELCKRSSPFVSDPDPNTEGSTLSLEDEESTNKV